MIQTNEFSYKYNVLNKLYGSQYDINTKIFSKKVLPVVFWLLNNLKPYEFKKINLDQLSSETNLEIRYVKNALFLLRGKEVNFLIATKHPPNNNVMTFDPIPANNKISVEKHYFTLNPYLLLGNTAFLNDLFQRILSMSRLPTEIGFKKQNFYYIEMLEVIISIENLLENEYLSESDILTKRIHRIQDSANETYKVFCTEISLNMISDISEMIKSSVENDRVSLVIYLNQFGFIDTDKDRNDIQYFLHPFLPDISFKHKNGTYSEEDVNHMYKYITDTLLKNKSGRLTIKEIFLN